MSNIRQLSVLKALSLGLSLGLNLASMPGNAQQVMPGETAPTNRGEVINRVLQVLDQVGTIIPGKGFNSIGLGASPEQLVTLWGPPGDINPKGILTYQLDELTTIAFYGKKAIDKIIVIGSTGSFARVDNGVIFGMTPSQVVERFTIKPDKATNDLLRYDDAGIQLSFENLSLIEIEIFNP